MPEEGELARAKRHLVGLRAISLQAESAAARRLASFWARGLPLKELGAESEKIGKVSAQDVEDSGAKYFPAAHQTLVAVGEEKVMERQFAPFGLPLPLQNVPRGVRGSPPTGGR